MSLEVKVTSSRLTRTWLRPSSSSSATTRQQLNAELQQVHSQLVDYLGRNGAASAVADLMMTVPSRDLRLLSADELHQFGLEGANPVQDDLERLRVLRQCGADFLHRKEAFQRALDRDCGKPGQHVDAMRDWEQIAAVVQALKTICTRNGIDLEKPQ